jgi:CBS domain-containing protein
MPQTIETVMTTEVETVDADAALVDAARLMHDRDIGDVVVTDHGSVAGIATDRDLAIRGTARVANPIETPVREVMSDDLVVATTDQTVDEAIDLMREHALRRLPVVEDGRLAGIVSLGDLAVQGEEGSVLGQISAAEPSR